jgi:hypothetical protein
VPDDVLSSGSKVPETPFSKAVELVEVPSYIHNLSYHDSVLKAEKETVTESAPGTMIAR